MKDKKQTKNVIVHHNVSSQAGTAQPLPSLLHTKNWTVKVLTCIVSQESNTSTSIPFNALQVQQEAETVQEM